jgi:hypothetical protein
LVGVVVVILAWSRSRTRFPYPGDWQAESTDIAAPTKLHFSALGACSFESGTGAGAISGGCDYTLVEGSAIVEYVYDWRTAGGVKNDPGFGRRWYKVKVSPEENGRFLTLHFLDGADLKDGEAAGEARQIPVLGKPAVRYRPATG